MFEKVSDGHCFGKIGFQVGCQQKALQMTKMTLDGKLSALNQPAHSNSPTSFLLNLTHTTRGPKRAYPVTKEGSLCYAIQSAAKTRLRLRCPSIYRQMTPGE